MSPESDADLAAKPATVEDTLLAELRDNFLFASTNEAKQRRREIDDLKFAALEQWDPDVKAARSGQQGGTSGVPATQALPPVPPRPCLVMDMLGQMVRQITNQQRNARLSVDVAPKSEGASKDTAELLQGIIRQIEYESSAQVARGAAFERAVKCGRGYYRLLLAYANDGDFDLDIIIEPILNQANVYLDPTHEKPDGSDAMWAFITSSLTWTDYKRQFPHSKASEAASAEEFQSLGDSGSGWIEGDGDNRKIRVVEYFRVILTDETLRIVTDGTNESVVKGEIPAGLTAVVDPATKKPVQRTVQTRTVEWIKANGIEILQRETWPGRYIPIIQVIGEQLVIPDSDDIRRYQGIVRPARDPQQGVNFMVSAQAEAIGLAPRAPFVGYVETIEGFESWWNAANTRNFSFLPIKMVRDGSGSALPPPQRQVAEPAIQAISLSLATFREAVKSATGVFDPSLGNLSAGERSGKAIMALQRQGEAGTSNFMDNLGRAVTYEGKQLVDLIPKVYTKPGRIVRMITGNDDTKSVMLNRPFVPDEQGQPQPADQGDPNAKLYDLLKAGEYSVTVKVGKSYDSAREEMASVMGDIITANPALLATYGDIYFGAQDFAGAPQLAKRAKLLLPPAIQQAEGDNQPSIQQMQQQMAQAQQMFDAMAKELKAKTEIIQTDTVKAQRELEKAKITESAENQRLDMTLANERYIAKMKVVADLLKTQATIDAAKAEQMVDVAVGQLDRKVEAAGAEADRQHEVALKSAEGTMGAREAERGRAHEADMAERQAQLQPAE